MDIASNAAKLALASFDDKLRLATGTSTFSELSAASSDTQASFLASGSTAASSSAAKPAGSNLENSSDIESKKTVCARRRKRGAHLERDRAETAERAFVANICAATALGRYSGLGEMAARAASQP